MRFRTARLVPLPLSHFIWVTIWRAIVAHSCALPSLIIRDIEHFADMMIAKDQTGQGVHKISHIGEAAALHAGPENREGASHDPSDRKLGNTTLQTLPLSFLQTDPLSNSGFGSRRTNELPCGSKTHRIPTKGVQVCCQSKSGRISLKTQR